MNMGSSRQSWGEFSNEAVKQVMDMPHNRRCNRHTVPVPLPHASGVCHVSGLADFSPDCRSACSLPTPSRLAIDQARRLSAVLSMATIQETARNLQNSIAEPLDHKHIGLIGGKSHG